MRVMPPVIRVIPPLTAMFVPQMLTAATLLARATGWSRRQLSWDRRANTLGRQTWLRAGWLWRRVLFPGPVVDGLNPVVFLRRPCGRDAAGLVEPEFADIAGGGGDLGRDFLVGGDQQRGAMADLGGQGLGLGLPRSPSCSADAGLAIGDRQVFVGLEPGLLGVGNGVQRPLFGAVLL